MKVRVHRRIQDERGAVLVAGLLLALSLFLVIGAAVDIGRAFIDRRELVSIADGAALSGSQALDLEQLHAGRLALDPTEAQSTALAVLASEPELRAQASASSTWSGLRSSGRSRPFSSAWSGFRP
jgi:Flp pilus assembly protein TadG